MGLGKVGLPYITHFRTYFLLQIFIKHKPKSRKVEKSKNEKNEKNENWRREF